MVVFLWCAAMPALGSEVPSLQELTHRLIAESLAPMLEIVEQERPDAVFALRGQPGPANAPALLGGYADYLLQRGNEVYELSGRLQPPAQSLLVELTPLEVRLEYGPTKRGFFGLGEAQQQRTAALQVRLRLSDPDSGRLLFDQERRVERVDWLPTAFVERPYAGDPLYVATSTATAAASAPKPSWFERGFAVGLLGGIIVIYFAGSS